MSTYNKTFSNSPILLFDGPCNLCSKGVKFFLRRDKKGIIKFASLQSTVGQELLAKFNLPLTNHDSLVLIDGDNYWLKTDAFINSTRYLGGIYSLSILFKLIPKFIRDFLYSKIAQNRYKWFGVADVCWLPETKYKDRFLK